MRRARIIPFLLAATVACTESAPTGVVRGRTPAPGMASFQLVIDVASGRITVGPTAAPKNDNGASFSLVGDEGVALHATNCTWSAIPNNVKLKRCTFDLSVESLLDNLALLTPTFPKPPTAVLGIVVFPLTSAALGVSGSAATANADWDNDPTNFFNDFSGCSSGKASDCYRSETFPELWPRETTPARSVGFDVDKAAQSVSITIMVAGNLRDAPLHQVTLTTDNSVCAEIAKDNSGYEVENGASEIAMLVGHDNLAANSDFRVFCGFNIPAAGHVISATLQMYQTGVNSGFYSNGGTVLADHVNFGSALDANDYFAAALQSNIGTLSSDATVEYKTLDVTDAVRDDVANGRSTSQFRFLANSLVDGQAIFSMPNGANPPLLNLSYR